MILSAYGLSKSYGSEDVFTDINFRVDRSDRIGLIGLNGCGKSTLMKIITGSLSADSGGVSFASGTTVGYLKQDLGLDADAGIYEETLKAFRDVIATENELERRTREMERITDTAELEKLSAAFLTLSEKFAAMRGYYYKNITSAALKGLGFGEESFQTKVGTLSGGQKMRVALAKLLISEPDILLLDEPTNYLDIASIAWLENYLASYQKAYIVVSHDRYFLDKTVNIIWELDGTIKAYRGNYTRYLFLREGEAAAQEKAYRVQSDYIKHQREVIRKLKSFNREKSVRRAESREKQLAKLEPLEKPKEKRASNIRFDTRRVISKNALKFIDLSVGYNGCAVVSGINAEIFQGRKVGICGDNAAGKSTFLKTVAGELPPIGGEMIAGAGVIVSYFRQHHNDLCPENSVLDELTAYSGADTRHVRDVLGSLLFSEDEVFKKIGVLSGGEQSRVEVAKLMLTPCNVLLLDEPTNHLDIASKEVFEEAIREFSGTVLLVTHDRYLLSSVCDCIMYISGGGCDFYNMSYEKASELINSPGKPAAAAEKPETTTVRQTGDAGDADRPPISKNELRRAAERLIWLEAEMKTNEEKRAALETAMNGADFYKDQQKAADKLREFTDLAQEHKKLEDEWLELTYLTEGK